MASFHIPQLKASLPILKECYGFDLDEIFDELLAAVPQGKTATDVHSPFNAAPAAKPQSFAEEVTSAAPVLASVATAHAVKNSALQADLDDLGDLLIEEDEPRPSQPVRSSSYAQSSAFVQAPIQHQVIAQPVSDSYNRSYLRLSYQIYDNPCTPQLQLAQHSNQMRLLSDLKDSDHTGTAPHQI